MKRWSISLCTLILGLAIGGSVTSTLLHGQNAAPSQPPAVFPRELTSYREVVKRVLPAVVSIETRAKANVANRPELPEEFRRFFDERQMPLPPIDPNRFGFGSGFFIDPSGVVVTNFHVVDGADSAIVQLQDGRKFSSKSIRTDRRTDLAVIILDVKNERFPTLQFGDSDAMEIGDRVLAVGAPFGLAGSVTSGIVSAKGRNGLQMNMYEDFLQTDAAINPGNSGGPLVNLEGKVVGINAAIKSKSGGFQGVGLAVASNLARNVVHALQNDGAVKRGYLGIQVRELDAQVATRLGLAKEGGVVVADVYDGTPAAKAGLKPGDILTRIGGHPVKDGNTLQRLVTTLPLHQSVHAEVFRDGKTQTLPITIEEQPTAFGINPGAPAPRGQSESPRAEALNKLGIDVADLTDALADDLGYRKGMQGVVVMHVHENGAAAVSDLKRGMLITKIDDHRITSTASARQAMQSADLTRGVLLQVASPQGGVSYVLVRKS